MIPEGLSTIVGVETDAISASQIADVGDERPACATGTGDRILFGKPANSEQHEIAARLPRGTGDGSSCARPARDRKTYATIANLLWVFAGPRKAVLVTAHTTKALRGVAAAKSIQSCFNRVCLSVLGKRLGEPNSDERVGKANCEIGSSSNAATLRKQAALLREKRRKLLDAVSAIGTPTPRCAIQRSRRNRSCWRRFKSHRSCKAGESG